MRRWLLESESETVSLGRRLGGELAPDGVLLLSGELGAGKTVLARGVAAALGVDPGEVQSPTYILVREHRGRRGRFVHVDLYRLAPEEVEGLGLQELLAGPGVKVVEWAERLDFEIAGAVRMEIRRTASTDDNTRREVVELATPARDRREE